MKWYLPGSIRWLTISLRFVVIESEPGMSQELRDIFVDVVHYKQDPGNAVAAQRMLAVMIREGMFEP